MSRVLPSLLVTYNDPSSAEVSAKVNAFVAADIEANGDDGVAAPVLYFAQADYHGLLGDFAAVGECAREAWRAFSNAYADQDTGADPGLDFDYFDVAEAPHHHAQAFQKLIDLAFGLVRSTMFTTNNDPKHHALFDNASVDRGSYEKLAHFLHKECPKPTDPPTVYVVTYNTDDAPPSSEVYATAELAAQATCKALRPYFEPNGMDEHFEEVEDDPAKKFLALCDEGRWLDAWDHYTGMEEELKDGDEVSWEAVSILSEVSA